MGTLLTGTITFLSTDVEGSTKLWEKYPEEMKSAVEAHKDYISGETLSVALKFESPPPDASTSEDEIDDEKVVFGFVVKA